MSTGNKAIPDLPLIPDPTGGSLYITKDNNDYRVDTGGVGGLATLGPDGALAESQRFSVATIPWSGVTSKPTTLAGYGITDAQSALGFTPVKQQTTGGTGGHAYGTAPLAIGWIPSDGKLGIWYNGVLVGYVTPV